MTLRVAVVGAGALGRLFSACLQQAGADSVLVARPGSMPPTHFKLQRQSLWRPEPRSLSLSIVEVRPTADVYVLAVRGEQLSSPEGVALCAELKSTERPVIVFSPALPRGIKELKARLPNARLALPALAADWSPQSGLLRYWVPPMTATLIETPLDALAEQPSRQTLSSFGALLRSGGIPVQFSPHVATLSPATTVAFFPLQLALAACPQFLLWRSRSGFEALVRDAIQESSQLAACIGRIEPGVATLTRNLQRGWLLSLAAQLAPRLQPRLCGFLEQHFGHKLHRQHEHFMREIEELAAAQQLPVAAMRALSEQAIATSLAERSVLP